MVLLKQETETGTVAEKADGVVTVAVEVTTDMEVVVDVGVVVVEEVVGVERMVVVDGEEVNFLK